MKYLYRIYQIIVGIPLGLLSTILTAVTTTVGCAIGNGHFWGYYPGKLWGRFLLHMLLLPVHIEGREKLSRKHSYVFVANHQGAFDIFLIYGFLGRNFKWMMKQSLRKMPFVGTACHYAHHIFVDKSSPAKVKATYDKAREVLKEGMSLVVFPEGARTRDGNMGTFKRGAFMLADELQLPIVPLTINGSFDVLPRSRDGKWITWHPLKLTIHDPIPPYGQGADNVRKLMEVSREVISSKLDR